MLFPFVFHWFPIGFPLVLESSRDLPLVLPCFFLGFPFVSLGFPLGFPWFSLGFPLVFLWTFPCSCGLDCLYRRTSRQGWPMPCRAAHVQGVISVCNALASELAAPACFPVQRWLQFPWRSLSRRPVAAAHSREVRSVYRTARPCRLSIISV